MRIENQKIIELISQLLISVTFFLSCIIVNNPKESLIFLCIIVGVALFGIIIDYKISFKTNIVHVYMLVFAVFCYLSSTWAINKNYSIGKGNTLLESLALIYVVYFLVNKFDNSFNLLLKSIMWGGMLVSVYIFISYGFDGLKSIFDNEGRIDNEILNANAIGMIAAYTLLFAFYYLIYDGAFLINLFIIISNIIFVAASGSRKAILIVFLGCFALSIFKSISNKNILKTIIKIFSIIIFVIVFYMLITKLSIFKRLDERVNELILSLLGKGKIGDSTKSRLMLMKIGKEIFNDNPIKGIGIDNPKIITGIKLGKKDYYLHNNYIELLAGGGIVGLLIYYSVYLVIFIRLVKSHCSFDRKTNLTIILLVLGLILDYGMVSYESKSTYFYLLLISLEGLKERKTFYDHYEKNQKIHFKF